MAALGFVRTVAYEHPVLVWYTVFLYACGGGADTIMWRQSPQSRAASFMAAVLLTIAGNVCATALMIQCILEVYVSTICRCFTWRDFWS